MFCYPGTLAPHTALVGSRTGTLRLLHMPRAVIRGFSPIFTRWALARDDLPVRVASWNVFFRSKVVAELQGELLRSLDVDLVMLQQLNPDSGDILRSAAGLDWLVRAVDLRVPHADDRPVRRRGRGPRAAAAPVMDP